MKRVLKDPTEKLVYWFFALRWHKCEACKREFIFERGWWCETGPYHGGYGIFHHVCRSCAPDRATAVNILDPTGHRVPPRPPPVGGSGVQPPPPPPRKAT